MTPTAPDLPIGPVVDPSVVAERPSHVTLCGNHVELGPLDPERDGAALYACSHGDPTTESLWTYLFQGPFSSAPDMTDWLRSIADVREPVYLAVRERATGTAIGMVSFARADTTHRFIELANIWYGPAQQRTAINTEAIYLMLRTAFEDWGYRRVEWKCDSLNARSRAAALRLGFEFEGIFRNHFIIRGRNRDTAWFAMLDGDWPTHRDALERWLRQPGGRTLANLRKAPAS